MCNGLLTYLRGPHVAVLGTTAMYYRFQFKYYYFKQNVDNNIIISVDNMFFFFFNHVISAVDSKFNEYQTSKYYIQFIKIN